MFKKSQTLSFILPPLNVFLTSKAFSYQEAVTYCKILNEYWKPDESFRKMMGIKEDWLSRKPNELSGGELQRFCIARVLGLQTKLLIADEISTMLDAITQAQIWAILLEHIKRENLGCVVVTHNVALAERICTRQIDLSKDGGGQ